MNYLVVILLALTAVIFVSGIRNKRDRELLAAEVQRRGGQLRQLRRVRRGSPFPDTTRGWWAWRVDWRDGEGERTSWALTTRDGLGEWRD